MNARGEGSVSEIFGIWHPDGDPDAVAEALERMAGSAAAEGASRPKGVRTAFGAIGWTDEGEAGFAREGGVAAVVTGYPRLEDGTAVDAAGLLEVYCCEGLETATALTGHYLLAIIDEASARLLILTDRAGVGTVYYAETGGRLAFASCLRALRALPDIGADISADALYAYLYFSRVPAPLTIFEGVLKSGPATRLTADNHGFRTDRHWLPRYDGARSGGPDDERALRALMESAIATALAEHRGQSVGAFLSGGLDSSTVASLLDRRVGPDAHLVHVSFEEEAYDESAYARSAAEALSCQYHELKMRIEDLRQCIDTVGRIYEEPFGNSSAPAAYFAAKGAAELGVEMLLAGDGGDEVFGGNERYRQQKIFELYFRAPAPLRKLFERVLGWRGWPEVWLVRKARGYIVRAKTPLPQRLHTYSYYEGHDLNAVFRPEVAARLTEAKSPGRLMQSHFDRVGGDAIDRMMYLDLQTTIADDDLRKVRLTSAANGVVARFPLLDDAIVEFANSIPGLRHVPGYRLRAVFRRAVTPLLPAKNLKKPKKGFGLPFGVWLHENAELYEDVLATLARLKTRGLLADAFIDGFVRNFEANAGVGALGQDMWCIYMLEKWFERHVDTPPKSDPRRVDWIPEAAAKTAESKTAGAAQ